MCRGGRRRRGGRPGRAQGGAHTVRGFRGREQPRVGGGVDPAALAAAQVKAHFVASGNSGPGRVPSVSVVGGANKGDVSWGAASAGVPSGQAQVVRYYVTAFKGAEQRQVVAVDGTRTS